MGEDNDFVSNSGGSPFMVLAIVGVVVCTVVWAITALCENSPSADGNYMTPVLNQRGVE